MGSSNSFVDTLEFFPLDRQRLKDDTKMKWELMTEAELHAFGIDAILPYMEKEGVTVEAVNRELGQSPQIVGQRWGSLASRIQSLSATDMTSSARPASV